MKRSPMKRSVRDTGPSPLQRAEVIGRAHGYCERCGASCHHAPYSIHHRLPRGRGGRNELANLVLLCGSATTPGGCHHEVERHRERAYDHGWLVPTGMEPAETPVNHLTFGRVLLDNDGGWSAA